MNTYIVFLRGINVSGKNIIKMADLRQALISSGYQNVKTYIQSGNLIFSSIKKETDIKDHLHSLLKNQFNAVSEIFIYTINLIKNIVGTNDFLKIINVDYKRIMVTFLLSKADQSQIEELRKVNYDNEAIHIYDYFIIGYFPKGYGKAKLNNNYIEKQLKTKATTRNWNTILKMIELADEVIF